MIQSKEFDEAVKMLSEAKALREFWGKIEQIKDDTGQLNRRFPIAAFRKWVSPIPSRSRGFNISTTFYGSYRVDANSSDVPIPLPAETQYTYEYMIKAMNALAPQLFEKAAELMTSDAAAKHRSAKMELLRMSEQLDELNKTALD